MRGFLFNKMKSILERRKSFKKKLINRMTPAEIILDDYLSANGISFKKQAILSPYIVDFLIIDKGLVIEMDGAIHNLDYVKAKDCRKDDYFMSLGLFVFHFRNEEPPNNIIENIKKFKDLSQRDLKTLKIMIARINGMANNKEFSKVMMDFSSYKEMRKLWKSFKSGYLANYYRP